VLDLWESLNDEVTKSRHLRKNSVRNQNTERKGRSQKEKTKNQSLPSAGKKRINKMKRGGARCMGRGIFWGIAGMFRVLKEQGRRGSDQKLAKRGGFGAGIKVVVGAYIKNWAEDAE